VSITFLDETGGDSGYNLKQFINFEIRHTRRRTMQNHGITRWTWKRVWPFLAAVIGLDCLTSEIRIPVRWAPEKKK
jgi:hypothetical protein